MVAASRQEPQGTGLVTGDSSVQLSRKTRVLWHNATTERSRKCQLLRMTWGLGLVRRRGVTRDTGTLG